MPTTLPLFDDPDEPVKHTRRVLQDKLRRLAGENLFIGTSSWKYPGWLDQIYTPERYYSRGKFSQKRFEAECLSEYAETFPVVCGDFSFYQFPTVDFWRKLIGGAPSALKYALKIPEEITVCAFPVHARYGAKAGVTNPNFLNADLLLAEFLDLLTPYAAQIAVLIFEFGAFAPSLFRSVDEFLFRLAPLVAQLPGTFRYAIEIRNPEFLDAEYFEFLAAANIAHVFNSWTRMPPVASQTLLAGAFTADFTVARALLRPGRKYEEAVKLFSPYQEIRDPNQEVRDALKNLLIRAKERAEPTYIFVNNRLEGNAPSTIEAIVADW